MTNEAKMTLEERIVQTLKDDRLMTIIGGDEDMIRQLVERALKEALFADRTVKTSLYGQPTIEPSAVVQAAEVAQSMVDEIMAQPSMKKAISEALPGLIVKSLLDRLNYGWDTFRDQAANDAVNTIRNVLS